MVDVKDYGNGFLTALVILALRNDLAVSAEDVTDLGGCIGEVLMLVTGNEHHCHEREGDEVDCLEWMHRIMN